MIVSSRLVTSRHVTSCHVMSRHVRENEIFINAVNLDCKLRSIFCALALFSSNKVSRRRSCCSRTTSRRTQNQMESKKFSSSRNVNVILNILENCLLLKLYRKTQKNVSEPQTGIEPATFWSPVRRSNHWATRTQIAELKRYTDISRLLY